MKKIVKIFCLLMFLAIAIPIVLFVGFLSLHRIDYFASDSEREFKKRLDSLIKDKARDEKLSAMVSFEWKEVCVDHAPMKLKDSRARQSIIEAHIWNMGFVKPDGTVEFFRIPDGDFLPLDYEMYGKCFTPEVLITVLSACKDMSGKCVSFNAAESGLSH